MGIESGCEKCVFGIVILDKDRGYCLSTLNSKQG